MLFLRGTHVTIPALKPGRAIEGISAVLLPYLPDDRPDWESFRALLDRTWAAGLTPAVNMDTGYVNLLSPAERARVLAETVEVGCGRTFVAGAFIQGEPGDPVQLYLREVASIRAAGGTPILFQCSALTALSEDGIFDVYAGVAAEGGPMLAFELGTMFAPFGRIYSDDLFRRIIGLEPFVGAKHSSLDRMVEWRRLDLRDQYRPGFKVYTGNDLAIDMVFYGSDYLLGLSAFHVEAFAARDRLWRNSDPRAFLLNDLLQYLGQLAFRAPVPAYKHTAAQFLKLRGLIGADRPHPLGATRPTSDVPLLGDIADRLDEAMRGLAP
jgi:dihydrodipicolinate synthase/N-acetylneuraminate lyase